MDFFDFCTLFGFVVIVFGGLCVSLRALMWLSDEFSKKPQEPELEWQRRVRLYDEAHPYDWEDELNKRG